MNFRVNNLVLHAERYINKNRESYQYLCHGAENQKLFLLSGQIVVIYHTQYGLCQLRPLDGVTNATK